MRPIYEAHECRTMVGSFRRLELGAPLPCGEFIRVILLMTKCAPHTCLLQLGGLQAKARDFFWIYTTAYVSLLAFGALNFAIPSNSSLSEFIVNLLGMFFATNLVCLREYIQGKTRQCRIDRICLMKTFFSQESQLYPD